MNELKTRNKKATEIKKRQKKYFSSLIRSFILYIYIYICIYIYLYNNTCSFCIFIGRELCAIKVHSHG